MGFSKYPGRAAAVQPELATLPPQCPQRHQNGLLRIQVPIVAPALGDDHRELMAALEQEAKDAETKVVELAQQLKEQQAKAREAQQALHSAKIGVHRACQTRRHALSIA